jgi:raffinose/stachyose/melibiose transport system substrate-binding protein
MKEVPVVTVASAEHTKKRFTRARGTLVVATTIAAVASLSLTAATGSAAPKAKHATVTLNILQAITYKPGQELLDANFERQFPNIHINATYSDNVTLASLTLAQLQAGNGPDAFFVVEGRGAAASVWALADAGRLMNLSDRPWAKRVPAYAKNAVSRTGKLYGWPFSLNPTGILYSVALWKQLGMTTPTNFAQTLSLCRKATAAGKYMFALGMGGATGNAGYLPLSQILMNTFVYSIDRNWNAERDKQTVKFATSSMWRRSYQALLDMNSAGCFNPSPAATTFSSALGMVANGQAVAMLQAASGYPQLKNLNPNLDLKLIPFPADKAANTVAGVASSAIVANAATAHPKETRLFMDFMARPAQANVVAKADGVLSPYLGTPWATKKLKGDLPSYLTPLTKPFSKGKVSHAPMFTFANPSMWFGVVAGYIPGLFTNQKTIDQILQGSDYMWDNPAATAPG